MKVKLSFIFLTLLLLGCQEELRKESLVNQSKQVQEITKDLYVLPPAPIPEPVIEELPPKEVPPPVPVEFPETRPIVREEQARLLRGKRQSQHRRIYRHPRPAESRYCLQDSDYQQGDKPLPEDRSTLPVDRSRILTADMRIGAILEDDVNSQIPGRIIAVVDRDILSPNGRFILLPAYTKIICAYEELEQNGDTRLPVSCMRAIRPDGVSILLTNATASDQMGRTGLIGKVDNRTFEKYGAAFIISGISALAQSGVNQYQICPFSPGLNNAANVLANNMGQVTAEVIRQNVDLKPIISIKAGSRIQIIPQIDIVLREPREIPCER